MAKEIIVNCDTRETRVALLDNGKLVELHIEREERVVGSIFKCKVCNVLPGMDAAFVDLGLERNAFLYVADVIPEADDDFEETPQRAVSRNPGRPPDEPGTARAGRQGPQGHQGRPSLDANIPAWPLLRTDARR